MTKMTKMTMTDVIRALVEEGLKQHGLTDQGCRCDSCTDRYGPEGTPGRCRWCYDAEQGGGCDDARRYAAIRDALTSGLVDDPLDENDHRDRIDATGQRWTHRGGETYPGCIEWCIESCYCSGVWDLKDINATYGPLRFDPDGGL